MTLYLKYRPQTIAELDLVSVRNTLQKIIASNEIPHGFLFSGPRGTGKTSAARILAKVINCEKNAKKDKLSEPCNQCPQCISITKGSNIDVIEMDAASNRGIDDIRTLRENVKLAPVAAAKKIYIIDEAHMLTTEASNALLKTLEEPPDHVVFILATTNAEKLPITIHSRLSTVAFSRATIKEIQSKLTTIAEAEKITADQEALASIAKAADGSFRDAVKLFEMLTKGSNNLDTQAVEESLFQNNILQVEQLLALLSQKSLTEALSEVERVVAGGGNIKVYMDQLISRVHQSVLAKNGIKTQTDYLKDLPQLEALTLLEVLIDARSKISQAVLPQIYLEIAICKWCPNKSSVQSPKLSPKETPPTSQTDSSPQSLPKPQVSGKSLDPDVWAQILLELRSKNASIEALLRAAKPVGFDGENLTLGVYYKFHKERLEIGSNRRTLEDVVASVYGKAIKVTCLLTEKLAPEPKKNETVLTEPKDSDIIKAAKEIFGN